MGDFKKAYNYLEKALDIYMKIHGEKHPEVALIYHNIGGMYSLQGDCFETLNYYKKALEIER